MLVVRCMAEVSNSSTEKLTTFRDLRVSEIVLLGIISLFSQIGLTFAYRFSNASYITPFIYLSVVFSYLYGIIIFNEIPNLSSIFGSIIVILAGILLGISEKRIVNGCN